MKKRIQKTSAFSLLLLAMLFVSAPANAQNTANFWEAYGQEVVVWGILTLEVIMLIVVITMYVVVKVIAKRVMQTQQTSATESIGQKANEDSFVQRIMKRLTDAVPVDREEEIMTDHAYDGIVELDNNLPPWWKAMFYLTIVFGLAYLLHFHVFDTGDLQNEEYEKQMAMAKAEVDAYLATSANNIDESNVTFVEDEGRIANGQTLFVQKCAPCHGQAGEGGVGPNLADSYWIHGGSVNDIFKTIKYGVPAKGMIPWNSQLSPSEMQDISSFIITLEGSNPPNPKEPQGELYERDKMAMK
ncbi:cbb3-type cytochrome c oxidase N-terminal domain-containing protein [Porifericola rhodea]|uniref:cbb3-type cytochrome c oxidase N-terminal domain-containing protein n=1 Tax=Porifericola rhodea TaxID=930972 RepID=UPI002666D0DB|nr:cbb3-type cytochrome c oxidase N-terminal domain-containing protein [Porifericola rhodea]WKN31588.1 cbb3-type cytochrome c oxidase N-terminal domain-containing protein [Porifericola rhodea]